MSKLVFTENFLGYKFEIFDDRPNFDVIHAVQVHGPLVLDAEEIEENKTEADGIISTNLNTPIAVKTADCLPIVVIGENGVANLHAGWRGVHLKISQSVELKKIKPKFFYIGPHIQVLDFEVQKDFKNNFPGSSHFKETNGKLTFNLAGEVTDQIKQSWPEAQIQISSLSTYGNPIFNSYRENGTKQRNWNVLSIED